MANTVLSVQRNELKYIMSYSDALALKKRLACVLTADTYSQSGPYRVKSLYFDSLNNLDYNAKLAGENSRKKIRLRIYDEDASVIKLEWKAKEGSFQQKSSLTISRDDSYALMKGNYQVLLQYNVPQAARFYAAMVLGCYVPVVLIEYKREAFIHAQYNTRITFDTEIKSSELCLDLFQRDLSWVPVIDGVVVLEIKYNEKLLGFISQSLKGFHLVNCSVSKYCMNRYLMQEYI